MKIFIIILGLLSLISFVFNIFLIDFSNPMEGKSFIALLSAGMAMIALFVLLIFYVSIRIKAKFNNKS